VGIYQKPLVIPPPTEVDEGRYHYEECPMQVLPPMPDHIFLHYLEHARRKAHSDKSPSENHLEDIFLKRLPKKLGCSIYSAETGTHSPVSYGWGVYIVERPSSFAQSLVGIGSALICMTIFLVTWICAGFNNAIGVGQFIAGVLALVNGAVYFAVQTYSTGPSRRPT
jgi:hypothetical protein